VRVLENLRNRGSRGTEEFDPRSRGHIAGPFILKADVVVFATPTHWFNVSALMKQLIDRMEEGPNYPCEAKAAFFIAVCNEDGGQQAINQMMAPFNHMGFLIPPYASYIYNSNMAEKSEDQWMFKGNDRAKIAITPKRESKFSPAFIGVRRAVRRNLNSRLHFLEE
jgi:NADPH-dependent FMN reductase